METCHYGWRDAQLELASPCPHFGVQVLGGGQYLQPRRGTRMQVGMGTGGDGEAGL